MRATSKRLCFIASMALSNNTLSGCFDPTLARGLTDFLLLQATVAASNMPNTAISETRRDIRPRNAFNWGQLPSAVLGTPISALFILFMLLMLLLSFYH